mmetsp:Transcript_31272/g.67444  ORF Transcript_31272/g.67444 Transcript_31272/m.67444 type:complete len:260 (-) Transcript_31272:52-831(-)
MKLSSLGRYPVEETTEKPLPGADSLSCRDLARERKLRQILSPGILEERFLPMELEGREVLLKEGDEWRADNRLLQAKTQGLSFRSSKSLDKSAKLASLVLPWGTLVSANDDGDGWVKLNAVGYLRIIEACDRVLGFPHFMQMRKTLQRLGACEEAMEALKIWKLHESEPPLRYTQARTPMGRSSLRKTQTEQLQRQTVRQLIHERQGEDSTTAYFGSSRPGTAGSCRSVWTRGSSQSTCVPSSGTPSLVPPCVGRLEKR